MSAPKMHRTFAMPRSETFSIKPISNFIDRWTRGAKVIVDPFARNSMVGTHRNDLDTGTSATWHMEAEHFARHMHELGVVADVVLFDPPYSPRQISEVYRSVGLAVGMKETQNASLYRRVRDALDPIIPAGGCVLSFGWHSNGMGKKRNYQIEELLLVAHGGAHNDTICVAETKLPDHQLAFDVSTQEASHER